MQNMQKKNAQYAKKTWHRCAKLEISARAGLSLGPNRDQSANLNMPKICPKYAIYVGSTICIFAK